MLTILYGENTVFSRQKLLELTASFKNQGGEIISKDGKKITEAELEQILGENNLFGGQKLVIIEQLHSLPRSKKKDAMIKMISSCEEEIILWENRDLTVAMLKKFPQAKTLQFKLTNELWNWLDNLGSEQSLVSLQLVTQTNSAEMVFAMLARQIRLLIQAKDSGTIKAAPFMISKLKKQASRFSMNQLLELHRQLLKIDIGVKTSTNILSLEQNLNLLVLNL